MGLPRKRQNSIWKPIKTEKGFAVQPDEVVVSSDPWSQDAIKRIASAGFFMKPSKRIRTFTGQIMVSAASMPNLITLKKKLLRVGISLFLLADVALIALFLKSIF
jgi:hypothetical protein